MRLYLIVQSHQRCPNYIVKQRSERRILRGGMWQDARARIGGRMVQSQVIFSDPSSQRMRAADMRVWEL